MITKVVTNTFDFGETAAQLVPLHSRGVDDQWMRKHASAGIFGDFINGLKPEKGKTVIHVIALGDEEIYGCLAGPTPVLRGDGSTTPISELALGDEVLSGEGTTRTVISLYRREIPSALRVKVEGQPDSVLMSLNHPVEVVRHESVKCVRDKYRKCSPHMREHGGNICNRGKTCNLLGEQLEMPSDRATAETLRPGDYLITHLSQLSPPREVSEAEAKYLGYWLAEGSFERNQGNREVRGWRFSFGPHERETLVADVERLGAELGLTVSVYDQRDQRSEWVVCVSGNPELAREHFSWFGSGSRNKRLPNWWVNLTEEARVGLLYGYFSGDGHMALLGKENRLTARSASYDLATGTQRLLWSIGAFGVVCPVRHDGHYNCSVAASQLPEELRFGFTGDMLVSSVKTRGFIIDRTVYLPIRAVEEVEWNDWIYNIEVEQDHSYVSAGFYSHNCNRNGDGFSREDNVTAHKTFKDIGHVYRNHRNDDPFKAVGDVIQTAHNANMSRVQLLLQLDDEKCRREVDALDRNEDVPVSMGSLQDYDQCSICQHKAPTAADHCGHIKTMLGQLLDDGRKVYMKNPKPKYFDISLVFKPADRIAYTLKKVAAAGHGVIGGHDLAEIYGLQAVGSDPKYATLKALAAMRKEIPTSIQKVGPDALQPGTVKELKKHAKVHGIKHLLAFMNANGWLMGPQDFGEVMGHGDPAGCAKAVDDFPAMDELFEGLSGIDAFDPPSFLDQIPVSHSAQEDLHHGASMEPEPAQKRVMRIAIIRPAKIATSTLDEHEARGFAALYGHYKLAFAARHKGSNAILKAVAATF